MSCRTWVLGTKPRPPRGAVQALNQCTIHHWNPRSGWLCEMRKPHMKHTSASTKNKNTSCFLSYCHINVRLKQNITTSSDSLKLHREPHAFATERQASGCYHLKLKSGGLKPSVIYFLPLPEKGQITPQMRPPQAEGSKL